MMPQNGETDAERQVKAKIANTLEGFSKPAQARIIKGAFAQVTHKRRSLEAELATIETDRDALGDIVELERAPKLEKPDGSAYHKLREAAQGGKIIRPLFAGSATLATYFAGAFGSPGVFVVEHDWASAFAKAHDFGNSQFRLPFDMTCFEFRISGKRVCTLFFTADGEDYPQFLPFVRTRAGWAFLAPCGFKDGVWRIMTPDLSERFSQLANMLGKQAEAIAVALDAEVAVTETVRAPAKLNAARLKRGDLPIADYHVVALARRSRAAPLPAESGHDREHSRRRLHFRRGHWRHYEDHKTWIRWTLVGDPDLGFIDKHYRL